MNVNNIIENTVKLIESNLDNQNLNINYLSKKIFVSKYYLQRIFYLVIGKL